MATSYLTMPLAEVKRMAVALTPHAAHDDVTPALAHIWLGGDLGNYAYASDRYTAGRYDLTPQMKRMDMPNQPLAIPREALSTLARIGKASLPYDPTMGNYVVEFEEFFLGRERFFTTRIIWHGADGNNRLDWMRKWLTKKDIGTLPTLSRLFQQVEEQAGELREDVAIGGSQVDKFLGYSKITGRPIILVTPKGELAGKSVMVRIGDRFTGLFSEALIR